MRLHTLAVGSAVTVLALSGLAASTASATPAEGPPTTTNPSPVPPPATLDGPLTAKSDGIKLKIGRDAIVRNFTLTYPIGASSGWHSHPGIVLAVVKSGTVVRKLPCEKSEVFTAGEAFTEAGPHFVRNYYKDSSDPDAKPADLIITQLLPAGTPSNQFRGDEPKPKCHRHS
jgi:hypothetical protein